MWLSGKSARGCVASGSILTVSDLPVAPPAGSGSPGGGCDPVAVELEEVVGGVDQPPLR
jgi:hypothetical protein